MSATFSSEFCVHCKGYRSVTTARQCVNCGGIANDRDRPGPKRERSIGDPATGDLFAPHNGTPTSRAAAESIDENTVKTQRQRIMLYVLAHGSATRDELEAELGIAGDAVRPRCRKLEEDDWLRPMKRDGVPVERPTRSNRNAQVYEPTAKAWEWWNTRNQGSAA